ncbi:hypothetical protein ASZ90_019692 [hydrocarbon metagenome]|uniref:Gamma-glutamylcyclotransferase AIG2-like domain-containing protein n=1 Tax=hydrocarbon metagenome TaxID=938273 RepID=A0A0W8E2Q7_9ZZZZ
MIRVFVYGTLMKNCYNHQAYLAGQRYLGRAVLPGYALYNLGSYPGVIPDIREKVLGEVYEINRQVLEQLDQLEDNGRLYIRKFAWVWINNSKLIAEVYVWNGKVRAADKIAFSSQPWQDGYVV